MKIALITALCTLGCMMSTAADSISHKLRQATARVIAINDINSKSVPNSKTGVLLSSQGYLYTVIGKGERIPAYGEKYMALFPVYTDGDDAVDGLKCIHGTVVRCDTAMIGGQTAISDTLVSIKLPETKNLPQPAPVLHNENARLSVVSSVVSCSFPNTHFTGDGAVSIEWKAALPNNLVQLSKKENDTVLNDGRLDHLMHYMQPKVSVCSIGADPANESISINNFIFAPGDAGAPAFYQGRVYGIISRTLESDARQTMALTSRVLTSFALKDDQQVGPPSNTGTDGPWVFLSRLSWWQWLLCAVGVVVIIVLVKLILDSKGKHRIVFVLVGEDGTYHRVTTDMLESNVLVGRSSSARVHFPHPTVSGKHAVLTIYNDRAAIVDENSTGGTYVNGQKLTPKAPKTLHIGDEIKLAEYTVRVQEYR